jgi:hypothetical protein
MANLTTELEAVNIMLSSIGESPVSSLSDPSLVDVVLAKSILDETSVSIQTHGLHSNTELNFPLTPNTNGEILIPNNVLKIDTAGDSADIDGVQRGTRLYDREKQSYNGFTGKVYVDMVLLFDFTDLPQHVRRYITVKASRRFQNRFMGSDTLYAFSQADENEALLVFERAEAANEDNNILTGSIATAQVTVFRGAPRRAMR